MSKATIEDKTLVLERLAATGHTVIDFDDYDQLLVMLQLRLQDDPTRKWSKSRLKRTLGSLHYTDRLLKVHRIGEQTCNGEPRAHRIVRKSAKLRSEVTVHVDMASL